MSTFEKPDGALVAEVIAVIGYRNPEGPRTTSAELQQLKEIFTVSECPAMVAFVDWLRFAEEEHGTTYSYVFSTRWSSYPDELADDPRVFLGPPDIVVGTRKGKEGAAVWLRNFTEAMKVLPPERIQLMDKLFSQAIDILQQGPGTPLHEILEADLMGEDTQSPKTTKH